MATASRVPGLRAGLRAGCWAGLIRVVACLGCLALTGLAEGQAQQASTPDPRIEEAKGLFTAGRAAFDAGRYADALRHFEQAYEMSQRAALLYNIGLAHDRLRSDEKALAAFEAYLAALPEAPNRAEVETRSQALRDAIARDEAAAPVPTPAETAAAGQPVAASSISVQGTPSDSADKPSILTRWWFWTIVGVVAAGAITTGVVLAGGSDTQTQDTLEPTSGVVVTTLGSAR
jgi:hypothetical protein